MAWQPIDFQGIIDLDGKIVRQLEQFLQEKDNDLAYRILNLIPLSLDQEAPGSFISIPTPSLKLSEAVEEFSKKARLFNRTQKIKAPIHLSADVIVKDVNSHLCEFVEILESCVVELFQQIRQVSIDRWHVSIFYVVNEAKNLLIHCIENFIWTIHRLEKPLRQYCEKIDQKSKNGWLRWFSFHRNFLDPSLLKNLYQSEKFLKIQYEAFQRHYQEYMALSIAIEDNLQKMKAFPVLALLNMEEQNLYIDIFRLLKMIELDRRSKDGVAADAVRALMQLASIDHVIILLDDYYHELEDAFFNSSLEWKSLKRERENFKKTLQKLQGKIQDYQRELKNLTEMMSRYRTFILKNDSNPYIRSRWGFTERIVAQEPIHAKKLLDLAYEAEELNGYYSLLNQSLMRDPLVQQQLEDEIHQEIERILHKMRQPLISQSMMHKHAEKLLEQIKACDEMGSPNMSTIDYVEEILSRALRKDWRYHVLHKFPLFHQLYRSHQGLVQSFEDPAHAFRLERFQLLFKRIEEWVGKEDVYSHIQEIELDTNDMKTYLQDFLAAVQRVVKEKFLNPFLDETIQKLRRQLLEYRYLFGQFFLKTAGIQLRNQFLFVDHYFESVENLLNELKASGSGKSE